jgi:hypothetical protein
MIKETVINESHCTSHPFKRICWTAILVGALVGVGLGFLLNLFGIAIGLSAFTVNQEGAVALAIGGLLGIVIAVIASMVVAGYAAGYLGRKYCPRRNLGILYGFVTWSVALLLSAAVMTHVNQYVSAYSHVIAGPMTVASSDKTVVTMESNKAPVDKSHQVAKVVVPTHSLACAAFLLFVLFFIGAVSTCVGACWAMNCQRDD